MTLGGIQILIIGAGLARTKVLALLLGPEGIGITGVIDQIVAFAAHAGSLSIPFAALRFLSRSRDISTERFLSLYKSFRRTLLVASCVAASAGIAFILFRRGTDELAPFRMAAILAMLSAPAMAILALERNVLAVIEKPRVASATTLVAVIALVASTYAGLKLGGFAGLYAGNLFVNIAVVVVVARYVRISLPENVPGPQAAASLSIMRSEPGLIRFCTLVHFLALGSPAAYAVSRLIVLDSGGSAAAGMMAAAFGIGVAVRTVLGQASALYLTPLANQSTPKAERVAAVARYARALVVLFLVATLPLALFPSFWIRILYSLRFVPAAATLSGFLIGEGLLLMAGVYQALLIGLDDLNAYLASSLVASGVVIGLSFALIPSHGIIGAAWALIGGNGILLVLTLMRLRVAHSVTRLGVQAAPLAVAIAILVAAGWWVRADMHASVSARLFVCLILSSAFVSLLGKDELRWIISPARERLATRE
ncbi:MAG: polysaccharide biosynthesis C-terminal domain-containing protein [Gemmatimonadales bacterium]